MKQIYLKDKKNIEKIKKFLKTHDLTLEKNIEKIYVKEDEENNIIATGAISKNVLKCIAIKKEYQSGNLINEVINTLIHSCYSDGVTNLFVYTKPYYIQTFKYLGFYELVTTDKVALLENRPDGINIYLNSLYTSKKKGSYKNIAGIVLNANPFTKGHLHLLKKASMENDLVYAFVVWEDKSIFPNEVRYKLIKKGCKDLENVVVFRGLDYIISSATFPSYFINDKNKVIDEHTHLDLKLFGNYIARRLKINKRYVGKEPFDITTNKYNQMMKKILPEYGIEVVEIDRIKSNKKIISASKVREMIKKDKINDVKDFVPKTTFDFLKSEKAESIINNIKSKE